MITDPLFYAVALPAVCILGLSKGGFIGLGVVAAPLISLVISPVKAAAILLPILIAQDMVGLWAFRRDFDKRLLAIVIAGAAVGTVIGTLLAAKVTDAHVRLIVGAIAVVFTLNHWFGLTRRLAEEAPPRMSVPRGLFWSTIAGFTSFVSHAGGPPYQVYVLPLKLKKEILVGTTTYAFAAINLIKVPPYWWLGQFTRENLATSAALMPVAIASTIAGVWLVRRVSTGTFYRIAYALVFAVGAKLLWDGGWAVTH